MDRDICLIAELYGSFNVNVNVRDFAIYPPPLRKLLRGVVICNMTPTQENRVAFSARLKQSGMSLYKWLADNWFQSCGPDTANAHRPYLSVATRITQRSPYVDSGWA